MSILEEALAICIGHITDQNYPKNIDFKKCAYAFYSDGPESFVHIEVGELTFEKILNVDGSAWEVNMESDRLNTSLILDRDTVFICSEDHLSIMNETETLVVLPKQKKFNVTITWRDLLHE